MRRFKSCNFPLERQDLFVLLDQHRKQHHLEGCFPSQVRAGRCVVARSGKQSIEGFLILPAEGPSVPPPRIDFLLDQLCEGSEGSPHGYNRLHT